MMFLIGLTCGIWISSYIVLWIEIRKAPLIETQYEMPVIRPHWGDIE